MFLFSIMRTSIAIILWCVVEKSYGVATVTLEGEDPCFSGASCSLTCIAVDGSVKTDGFLFSQSGNAVIDCQDKNTCSSLVPTRYSYTIGNDTYSQLTISNFNESTRGGQWCCHDGLNGNKSCRVVIENSVPSNLTFSPETCIGKASLTVSCSLDNIGKPSATLILSNSSTTLARQATSPLSYNLDSSDSVTCSYQWDAFPNYALGTTSVTTECNITTTESSTAGTDSSITRIIPTTMPASATESSTAGTDSSITGIIPTTMPASGTVNISVEDGTVRFLRAGEISSIHMIVKGSPLPDVIVDGGASFSEQAVNATAKAVTVSAAAQPGSIRKVVVTATNSEGSSSVTLLVCTDPCLYVNALAFVIVLGCLQVASILSCIPHFKPVLVRDLYKMVQVRDALTGSTIICDVVFVIVVGSVNLNLQSCLECLYNSDVHLHNSSIAFVIIGSTGCVSKVVIICYSMKRRNRSPEIAASDSGSKKDVNLGEVNSSESKRSDEDQEKGNGDVGQKSPKAGGETKPRPLPPSRSRLDPVQHAIAETNAENCQSDDKKLQQKKKKKSKKSRSDTEDRKPLPPTPTQGEEFPEQESQSQTGMDNPINTSASNRSPLPLTANMTPLPPISAQKAENMPQVDSSSFKKK